MLEMQGYEQVPTDIEDEVFVIDEDGNLVRMEVEDDAEDNTAQ